MNVFTPADEVQDVDRFAGRTSELQSLSRALESDGVQIVIYGNRGVGKSSIARLLEKLARNDPAVLARLPSKPHESFDFLPIYFRCDDSIRSIPGLLLRLLTDSGALADWIPFRVVAKETTGEVGANLTVKIFSLGGRATRSISEAPEPLEQDVVSVFSNTMKKILDSGIAKSGVLLIIDEFDRIGDRRGLASLMKTLGPQQVTFALVGVATTVQELITDHESVARQLSDGSIHVSPMSDAEMNEIFDRAEQLLEGSVTFGTEARQWMIRVARGHPFYVHLIGKHALLRTIEENRKLVTLQTAQDALREIALKGSAPIQETLYKTAIGHSYVREVVLKSFAAATEDEIHTTEIYAGIAKKLNIDIGTVSVYVGHLANDKYGRVLEKSRERYYRFRDSLFKAYAAARPEQLKPGDQEEE